MSCNAVAQNASLAQGRAIITLVFRGFPLGNEQDTAFIAEIKQRGRAKELPLHFPLCFAIVCRALGVSRDSSMHLLLFYQARSIVSAAIRLNLLGPYQAQTVLLELQEKVEALSGRVVEVGHEVEYYQSSPVQDIVTARHSQCYSRLFNS
jgi:urease accessory protein